MTISLPYGKEKVFVELPRDKLVFVVKPKDFPGVEEEEEEIRKALRNPIGTPKEQRESCQVYVAKKPRVWYI